MLIPVKVLLKSVQNINKREVMKSEEVVCLFPTCKSHPQKNGYCIGHRIYASNTEKKEAKEEKPKPIAKRSEKMKENVKALKKEYPLFLARPENKYCQLKMNGCTKVATVVHHTQGREGANLTDQSTWMPSCAHCNIIVEEKDGEARDKGVKKSKHNPNYKRSKV